MAGQHHIYHWKHGWIPLTHAAAMSKAKGNSKLADKFVPGASHHHDSRIATHGMSAAQIHATLAPHKHHSDAAAVAKLRDGDHALVHGMDEHGHATSFAGTVHGTPTVVRIKQGQNGKVEHHLAVPMHNGSDRSGGDASARTTVYVKNPDGMTPAQASKSRLAIRAGSYQGQQGHHITGTNKGRTGQRVFVPGDRKDAETVKANMLAGKDRIFEGTGAKPPRATRGSMGERITNAGGPVSVSTTGLPNSRYVITSDSMGLSLKHNGKIIRTSSDREALRKFAAEHHAGAAAKPKSPLRAEFEAGQARRREAEANPHAAAQRVLEEARADVSKGHPQYEQAQLDKLAGERTKFYPSPNGGTYTLHRNHPLAPAGTVGVETAGGAYVGHMRPTANGRITVTPHSAPGAVHDVKARGQALAALHAFHEQDKRIQASKAAEAERAAQAAKDRASGATAERDAEQALISRVANLEGVKQLRVQRESGANWHSMTHEQRMTYLTERHATALAKSRRARARALANRGPEKMTPPKVSRTVNDTPTMQANRGKIGAALTAEPVPFHGDHPLREGQRVTVTHNGEKLEGHVIHAGGGTRGMAYFPTAKLYYDGNRFWTGQEMKDHVIADRKRHAANFTRGR